VLRGEAGAGKSALVQYVSARAATWRVLSAVGVESEMELAYNGLHQLCGPLFELMDRLPAPQRDALGTVFGVTVGPVPARFVVALAALSLLAEAAEHEPVLCVVDDAHWLDQASAQVLAFVARRLLAERVGIVAAARTGIGDQVLAGMPKLSVRGLNDRDGRELLLENLRGPVDPEVCEQIVAESHGNPLALLELPRGWTAEEVAGGFGILEAQHVTTRIHQSYARRIVQLPADSRLLVLAAAAESIGDPGLLQRAVHSFGVDMKAAGPAVDAGVLQIRRRVEFVHPLARAAAYQVAPPEDRRRAHQALADATDPEVDPDRRAWHRARAAAAPDEDVAVELEHSAARAGARGGMAAVAAFLTRASELTPDPVLRVSRALGAAAANVQAGSFDTAFAMLEMAEEGPVAEPQRAMMDLLRAQLAFASSRGNDATPLLMAAAGRLESLDPPLARQTYVDAFGAALFGARLNDTVGVSDVARAARAAPAAAVGESSPADLLLDALVGLSDGYAAGAPACKAAVQHLRDVDVPEDKLRWLWLGGVIALELWDAEGADSLSSRHVRIARQTGALSDLALALSSHIPVLVFRGELRAAASLVAEASSVEEATGITAAPYGALIVAAWRSSEREARELIGTTIRAASARGEGVGVAICEYSRAVLCNSFGRYEEGLIAAQGASDYREVVVENWGLVEVIEAAARTGRVEVAAEALDRLSAKARASGTDWVVGVESRSRALLSHDDDAESLYQDAIGRLGRVPAGADLARAHLLYGEWLRRTRRRVDARTELHGAFDMFTDMGMDGFAERARREVLATGATLRKRTPDTEHELTPQEAQIARLARDDLSNREIGAQLFISARTVEWHMRKVFTKLGVSSRRQLHQALADVTQP
jgi:DNA-binding CsgD family transcriptional regulator